MASGSIFVLGNYTHDKNYALTRSARHQQYQQAFASVLKQLQQKETELSWLIPALVVPANGKEVLTEIQQIIDNNWFKIELESDIRSICLASTSGDIRAEWGEPIDSRLFAVSWLETVVKNEQPINKIVCDTECVQYHALPFLYRGKFSGVFVFGSSITDIVIHMKGITGADIGILVHAKKLNGVAFLFTVLAVQDRGFNRLFR
nr:cache domain-containing protein [Methylomarinum sp. Ch1-1]MDP4519963.1 cache domain-containing protein [Methylomarinum sp. Ch1-1]